MSQTRETRKIGILRCIIVINSLAKFIHMMTCWIKAGQGTCLQIVDQPIESISIFSNSIII